MGLAHGPVSVARGSGVNFGQEGIPALAALTLHEHQVVGKRVQGGRGDEAAEPRLEKAPGFRISAEKWREGPKQTKEALVARGWVMVSTTLLRMLLSHLMATSQPTRSGPSGHRV